MIVEHQHSTAGKVKSFGLPVKFSEPPGSVDHPAPVLGEHTVDALQQCGYSIEAIEGFIERGIVKG